MLSLLSLASVVMPSFGAETSIEIWGWEGVPETTNCKLTLLTGTLSDHRGIVPAPCRMDAEVMPPIPSKVRRPTECVTGMSSAGAGSGRGMALSCLYFAHRR